MAEMSLYPENLKGFDLSFAESIYAITFGLENEIRSLGKEKAFEGLGLTAEQKAARVEYCLHNVMDEESAYVLRRVLGDLDSPQDDEKVLGTHHQGDALEGIFKATIDMLYLSMVADRRLEQVNYRYLLVKDLLVRDIVNTSSAEYATMPSVMKDDIGCLDAEVQRLKEQARMYDKKRAQVLRRIDELTTEIQRRRECSNDSDETKEVKMAKETKTTKKPKRIRKTKKMVTTNLAMDLDGPITQVCWPYRSRNVLHGLHFSKLGEVVDFFDDFAHLNKRCTVTLLEWLVITQVLRMSGLLSKNGDYLICQLETEVEDIPELIQRTDNYLMHGGVYNFDDFIAVFADGANKGWSKMEHNWPTYREQREIIMDQMQRIVIELDNSFVFPTSESSVKALDFGRGDRCRLSCCGLNTIGELLAAYRDENRFSGLQYLDSDLFVSARLQLRRYGFIDDDLGAE